MPPIQPKPRSRFPFRPRPSSSKFCAERVHSGKRRLALVVEEIHRLVRDMLVREGFSVSVAASGEALDHVLTLQRPDLMILDLMLPGEDGLSICRRLLLSNVTANAITYGHEAAIRCNIEEGMLVITVDDKGPGISAEHRWRVLEPFVRLEESRNRRTGGAGLGLAIAQKAAEAHGGTLALDEAPCGGTRAIVRLRPFSPER